MAQAFADDLDRHPGLEELARVGVAEVVETNLGARLSGQSPPRACERVWVPRQEKPANVLPTNRQ